MPLSLLYRAAGCLRPADDPSAKADWMEEENAVEIAVIGRQLPSLFWTAPIWVLEGVYFTLLSLLLEGVIHLSNLQKTRHQLLSAPFNAGVPGCCSVPEPRWPFPVLKKQPGRCSPRHCRAPSLVSLSILLRLLLLRRDAWVKKISNI